VSEPLKRCSKCAEEKPLDDFHRNARKPYGRQSACKACVRDQDRERNRRWREANPEKAREKERRRVVSGRKTESDRKTLASRRARSPEQIEADRRRLRPDGVKRCRSGHWLPFEAFSVDNSKADGLNNKCRACDNAGLLRAALPRWEDADHWRDAYTGEDFAEVEHTIPKSAFGPGDADPNDAQNLLPASVWTNRGQGGKHTKAPLDFVEELYPGLLDLIGHWPVEERTLSAA
jgi:hypothetical protein